MLIFAGLIPGARLNPPSGSTEHNPLFLELPGEIHLYDTQTYQKVPVEPLTTPSVSHVMEIVPVD